MKIDSNMYDNDLAAAIDIFRQHEEWFYAQTFTDADGYTDYAEFDYEIYRIDDHANEICAFIDHEFRDDA